MKLRVHTLPFRQNQDLGNGKQADQCDDDRNPLVQRGLIEGVAQRPGHRVHADGTDDQPNDTGHQALDRRSRSDGPDGAHGEDHDPEELRRTDFKRNRCHDRRAEQQKNGAHLTADKRRTDIRAQSESAPALFGHFVAVQHGGDGGRRARHVDQDAGNGAAIDGAAVDGAQKDQGGDRRHVESEGHEQGDPQGR